MCSMKYGRVAILQNNLELHSCQFCVLIHDDVGDFILALTPSAPILMKLSPQAIY